MKTPDFFLFWESGRFTKILETPGKYGRVLLSPCTSRHHFTCSRLSRLPQSVPSTPCLSLLGGLAGIYLHLSSSVVPDIKSGN